MGACDFRTTATGKFKNVNDAYAQACNDAIEYYGHQEGYNGTISTTGDVKLITDAPKYGTKAYYKWEDEKIETMNKRDCMAVEIKGKTLNEMKEKNGLKGKKGIKAFCFFGIAAE